MGISTAGHLPYVTSSSFPALSAHLVSSFNAQRIANWTITIRIFRSTLNYQGESGAALSNGGAEGSKSVSNARPKLMFVAQLSEFPDESFVLIEDPNRDTRTHIRGQHALAVTQAAMAAQAANSAVLQDDAIQAQEDTGARIDEKDVQKQAPLAPAEDKVDDQIDATSVQDGQEGANDALKNSESEQGAHIGTAQKEESAPDVSSSKETSALTAEQPLDATTLSGQNFQREDGPSVPTPAVSGHSTRSTLFAASSNYLLLLSRLNLPPALGAPSMGDGAQAATLRAGPGAWLPRGGPITFHGAIYDLPSAVEFGGSGSEWRVKLGMAQAGGTRNAGAIVESEYMPLLRLTNDAFLTSHLQSLFPPYLTAPPPETVQMGGVLGNGPTPEQWQEVIPASNEAWMETTGISNLHQPGKEELDAPKFLPSQQKDRIGWRGKERGRRLAYLYITLLRNQSII